MNIPSSTSRRERPIASRPEGRATPASGYPACGQSVLPVLQVLREREYAHAVTHFGERILLEVRHGVRAAADTPWPQHDPALLAADTVTIGVQVNGKLRASITLPRDAGPKLSPEAFETATRDPGVNAGEKMHQRAGVKLHQDGMPKASIGGLLLGDKQDEKRIASPENVTQASSVASPPMFPLPH